MTSVPLFELSASAQNYLKAIWSLQEWSAEPVTASNLAAKVGVKLSTVSGAIGRLSSQGLVQHSPYGAVQLTDTGHHYALMMVRRHRLVETFLVQSLGYTWDQVHDEAENLEHAISDFMVERIDAFLGHPSRDPHGDPIPTASGKISMPDATQLTDAPHGTPLRVERISDHDPDLLRHFAEHGLDLDSIVVARAAAPFVEGLEVELPDAGKTLSLGQTATDAVWVSQAGS